MSTAEWTGVPLVEVLDRAGVAADAREIVLRGADSGTRRRRRRTASRFERSLSLDDARSSEALLAYAMNGEPLPVQHGYPLRVIVPGWYAVTSVKWLTDIEVIGVAVRRLLPDRSATSTSGSATARSSGSRFASNRSDR